MNPPAQILPRRILASSNQSFPLLRPLQHPARISIRRLRLPRARATWSLSPILLSFRTGQGPVRNLLLAGIIQERGGKHHMFRTDLLQTSASSSPAAAPASAKPWPTASSNSEPPSTSAAAAKKSSSKPPPNSPNKRKAQSTPPLRRSQSRRRRSHDRLHLER